jgi:hypothetical protein
MFLSSRDHLLEVQRVLKKTLYVGGTEDLLFEPLFHGSTKNLRTVALQDVVKPIDVVEPLPGPAMNDLGEIVESRLSY